VEDDSHDVFRQKFPGEKGSVRQCFCHDETVNSLVAKVEGEVFAYFYVANVVCEINYLAYRTNSL
jgi:hypothetical protein